jgi:hypothetical protein
MRRRFAILLREFLRWALLLRWMDGTGFFAWRGAFMPATGRNDRKGGYVWIGAKTERPLQFLRSYVGNGCAWHRREKRLRSASKDAC